MYIQNMNITWCVCLCVCVWVWVCTCYIVGNRKQYSKIDSYIPSKLWGTENKRNLPCEIHGRIGVSRREPTQISVCIHVYIQCIVCVCVCVLHICAWVCMGVCPGGVTRPHDWLRTRVPKKASKGCVFSAIRRHRLFPFKKGCFLILHRT